MGTAEAKDAETKMEDAEGAIAEPEKRETVDAPAPVGSEKRAEEDPSPPSAGPPSVPAHARRRSRRRSPRIFGSVRARVRARVSTNTASRDTFAEGGERTRDAYNTLFIAGCARDALRASRRAELENNDPRACGGVK